MLIRPLQPSRMKKRALATMVMEDRNLRPARILQPLWLVVAVLLLTARGETPPASETAPAELGINRITKPVKVPRKRVRPDYDLPPTATIRAADFAALEPTPSGEPGSPSSVTPPPV